MTMGLEDASPPIIPHEEQHVSLLQEVQDLEDHGDRLVFSLDDGRQCPLMDYLQGEFRRAQVRTHLLFELVDGSLIVVTLARDVQVTKA